MLGALLVEVTACRCAHVLLILIILGTEPGLGGEFGRNEGSDEG
jgi:hypothetical protein